MAQKQSYTPTEAKYKGGAEEMYVTYDLEQETRGNGRATYAKVKRVYVPGELLDWQVGDFVKKSGKEVHGVRIEYQKPRKGYTANRSGVEYEVKGTEQRFTKIVEVPERASDVELHSEAELPDRYRSALQGVR